MDSAMMLVTFLNILSSRYYEGKLINPCIRMVTTILGEEGGREGGRGGREGGGREGLRKGGRGRGVCERHCPSRCRT